MKSEKVHKKELVEWRRSETLVLWSQGNSQRKIAEKMKVSLGTVNKDIMYLREQAKVNIQKYIDEEIPAEYEKCLTGLNSILFETWNIANNAQDTKEKMQALALVKECLSQKLELLTNSNVINDSIRFIEKSKSKISDNTTTKKVNNSNNLEGLGETNNPTESTTAVF